MPEDQTTPEDEAESFDAHGAEFVGMPGVGLDIYPDAGGKSWICWAELVALHAWLGSLIEKEASRAR